MERNTHTNAYHGSKNHRAGAGLHGDERLQRLDDLGGYKVADDDPDVRGWSVHSADGKKVGRIHGLIADTEAMCVRYLEVELDRKGLHLTEDRHVLVPIGGARLDDDRDDVFLRNTTMDELLRMPPYRHDTGIADEFADAERDRDHGRDAREFYGKRGTGRVERLTLAEEELRVGKRTTQAGAANIQKTVETRHVKEKVPLAHEELVVERRAADRNAGTDGRIGENGEVRIPLMAEEAVVEKRAVPTEEVVIRKEVVRDEKTVEADLRRERLDVDRDGTQGRGKHH